jgi:hypothetical protein
MAPVDAHKSSVIDLSQPKSRILLCPPFPVNAVHRASAEQCCLEIGPVLLAGDVPDMLLGHPTPQSQTPPEEIEFNVHSQTLLRRPYFSLK